MSCYISSNNERFYVALESAYGQVPAITSAESNSAGEADGETGSGADQRGRTRREAGHLSGCRTQIRRTTSFQIDTLMTEWTDQTAAPTQGPLFQAAMGRTPVFYTGGTVAAVTGQTEIQFTAAHGLIAGQAVTFGRNAVRGGGPEYDDGVSSTRRSQIRRTSGAASRDHDHLCRWRESLAEREHFRLSGIRRRRCSESWKARRWTR